MGRAAKKLLTDVLALPDEERAHLAAALIASLDEDQDEGSAASETWAAELERRAQRVLSGDSTGEPWERVRERLLARVVRG
jgi:putative addiction module component (TIGR02574 family)